MVLTIPNPYKYYSRFTSSGVDFVALSGQWRWFSLFFMEVFGRVSCSFQNLNSLPFSSKKALFYPIFSLKHPKKGIIVNSSIILEISSTVLLRRNYVGIKQCFLMVGRYLYHSFFCYACFLLDFKALLTNFKALLTNFKALLTNFKALLTNFKLLLTNFKPILTNFKALLTNFKPLLTNFKPLLTNFKALLTNFKPLITNFKALLNCFEVFLKKTTSQKIINQRLNINF